MHGIYMLCEASGIGIYGSVNVLFLNDTATTEIFTYGHTRALHDALPIFLQAEGEAAGGAEALDRRRRQREGEAVLDLHEPAVHPPGDSACGILGAALAPVLQSYEGEAGILAGAGEAVAGDSHAELPTGPLPAGGHPLIHNLWDTV